MALAIWGSIALPACKEERPEAQPSPVTVRVTGIPDENPTELQRRYAPLVEHLERALGAEVTYVPVTDYGAAVQALAANQVEFAWLGGFTFVQAKTIAGAVPICMREVDRNFKSVFIAATGSGIEKLEQLQGRKFAFGSKSSTSGHLMPRHFLKTVAEIEPERDFDGLPLYSGAHDATVKLVESGRVDAGAVNFDVWRRMVEQKKLDPSKVRVIWTTPGYVDYVWAAGPETSPTMREKFETAFLSLDPANPKHREVLSLQSAKKFVAASPSDFDAIEAIARSTGLLKR